MSFFQELKRRNVFRVGIAYAVAAWIILQATDVIGEILELPPWGGKLILLMVGVGFFLAIFLAWAFELTPEGVKRESQVDRSDSITPQTGRKLDRIIIGLLVLALGYFVWEARFKTPADIGDPAVTATASTAEAPAAESDTSQGANERQQSIVVLPFVNMSADPNQEYFSDGLSEEILNALVKVDDLRVISRTSAFAYKNTELSIPQIADQLKVSHVLEGSVRTAGDQVRITAQLIEADSDSHLWSEAYSRSMDNVFEVQEEISRAIADQLQLRLSDNQTSGRPTDDVDAYRLFLRGRHHYQLRGDEDLARAIDLLRQAVAIDPTFDEAWANLAAALLVTAFITNEGHEQGYAAAADAAGRAIALNPRNGLAQGVQGLLAFRDFDYQEALARLDLAIEYNPNESNSYLWKGIVLMGLGYIEDSIDVLKAAETFDPAFANLHNWLALGHLSTGDVAAAIHHRDMALAVDPAFEFNSAGDLARLDGGVEAEIQVIRNSAIQGPEGQAIVDAYVAALLDPQEVERSVAIISASDGNDWLSRKNFFLYRLGAVDAALNAWRDEVANGRTLRAANGLNMLWSASDRENLTHPSIVPFLEENGITDHWRAHGDPDFCRAVGDSFECGTP